MNPQCDYEMRPDDEILIVADDDSTIEFLAAPVASCQCDCPAKN